MLRLRPFAVLQPASVAEAIDCLSSHGESARVIAGGTDVLPSLKLGLHAPSVLVSLRAIDELRGVTVEAGEIRIGAGTTLDRVASSPIVREALPALAHAAAASSSPQLRRMGTLGGNVCLDTRCRYVNQSSLFRASLGGCLKSAGAICHVVPGGTSCVAALSADTVPALVALDARVDVRGPAGMRTVTVEALRGSDGVRPVLLEPNELLTTVRIPVPSATTSCVSRKWAVRQAIDFPLVSLALRIDRVAAGGDVIASGRLVLGVLGPKPRVVSLDSLAGETLDDRLVARVGDLAFESAKTLPNVPYDPAYRRERFAVETRRAARSLQVRGIR